MPETKNKTPLTRPIGIGIIGCGEVASLKHLPAIRAARDVNLIALADVDPTRATQAAAKFGVQHTCTTIDELLQISNLDAVAICTPPGTHTDMALAALRAGKHVWIDQPIALCEADCRRIIDEAARAGTIAMTGLHMRYHRLVSAARAAIRSGQLGRIESIRLVWHSPRSDENVPDWKLARAAGGGSIVEIAPHHLDLLRYLLDTDIADIAASSNDGVRDDENAVVSGRLTNGVVFSGEFSERSPHEVQIIVSGSTALLTIDCLKFEGFNLRTMRQVPGAPIYRLATAGQFWRSLPRGVGVMRRGGDYMISYVNAWRVFFDAIRGQATEYPTLQDGLRMTQTATAAMESLQRRVIVPLPPVGVGANATAPHGAVAHSAVTTTGTTPPTFSIVVPTYNRPSHLHGLLQSLALQRFPREQFEVVVVDDGGMRPLDSVVAPFQEQLQIRLLRQANRGCAPARQFGIEAARGRFLAFTDDDCRPSPDWLSHLHACLLRHPGSAVIGPTINGLDHDLYAETTQLIVNWLTLANVDPEGRVDYGPTCNIAFPAKLFLEIGGLDKNWSIAGGEDRDLCARWFDAGLDLYFEPQAQVTHFHPLTRAQFLRQHFFYGRGARKFRRAKGAEQTGSRAFNRLGSYVRLMSLPVQQYDGSVALKIAANLVLAQLANAWGMAMEMLGRRLAAEEEEDVQVLAER